MRCEGDDCGKPITGRVFIDSQKRRVCYKCGDRDAREVEVRRREKERIDNDAAIDALIESATEEQG